MHLLLNWKPFFTFISIRHNVWYDRSLNRQQNKSRYHYTQPLNKSLLLKNLVDIHCPLKLHNLSITAIWEFIHRVSICFWASRYSTCVLLFWCEHELVSAKGKVSAVFTYVKRVFYINKILRLIGMDVSIFL